MKSISYCRFSVQLLSGWPPFELTCQIKRDSSQGSSHSSVFSFPLLELRLPLSLPLVPLSRSDLRQFQGGSQLPLPTSTPAPGVAGASNVARAFCQARPGLTHWAPQSTSSARQRSPVTATAASASAVVELPPAELPQEAAALTYLEVRCSSTWLAH